MSHNQTKVEILKQTTIGNVIYSAVKLIKSKETYNLILCQSLDGKILAAEKV